MRKSSTLNILINHNLGAVHHHLGDLEWEKEHQERSEKARPGTCFCRKLLQYHGRVRVRVRGNVKWQSVNCQHCYSWRTAGQHPGSLTLHF